MPEEVGDEVAVIERRQTTLFLSLIQVVLVMSKMMRCLEVKPGLTRCSAPESLTRCCGTPMQGIDDDFANSFARAIGGP